MCEMLKPKLSGYFFRSRFRRVDFPEPEGPETTIGRGVGADIVRRRLLETRKIGLRRVRINCWMCCVYPGSRSQLRSDSGLMEDPRAVKLSMAGRSGTEFHRSAEGGGGVFIIASESVSHDFCLFYSNRIDVIVKRTSLFCISWLPYLTTTSDITQSIPLPDVSALSVSGIRLINTPPPLEIADVLLAIPTHETQLLSYYTSIQSTCRTTLTTSTSP